jgi:uncharacterized protein
MKFEWDESKRAETLKLRSLDFADADMFFDGRPVVHIPSIRNGEDGWRTVAKIEGSFFTLVWMWRSGTVRVISMRRAHEDEERAHHAHYR